MSELFINTIANNSAGIVGFQLPYTTGTGGLSSSEGYAVVIGFLAEDPVINMKTNWEALLPDVSNLSDWSNLATGSSVSWIASTKATWKGTDPITLSLTFYLLTYRKAQLKGGKKGDPKDMPVSEQAARFAALLAVSPKDVSEGDGPLAEFGINVHGNYRANVFEGNTEFTGNKDNPALKDAYTRVLGTSNELLNDANSTVSIMINGNGKPSQWFSKMLLADATFTPSPVRCGYWENHKFQTSSEPLYIKVQATFRLAHTATVTDAVRMFTGKGSL